MLGKGVEPTWLLEELDLTQLDALLESLLRHHYEDIVNNTYRQVAAISAPYGKKGSGFDAIKRAMKPYEDWLKGRGHKTKPKKDAASGLSAALASMK